MQKLVSVAALCIWLGIQGTATAHFIWIGGGEDPQGNPLARLWFSDAPEPGEPELISKVANTRCWVRQPGGEPQPLTLAEPPAGGELAAALPCGAPCAVEALCDYGIIEREGKAFLLHYGAKHLRTASAAELRALARSEALPLDIVPEAEAEAWRLTVLWNGQPAPGAQVVVIGADGDATEQTTDDQGQVSLTTTDGRVTVRARWIDPAGGERDGRTYQESRYYTTVNLESAGGITGGGTAEVSAEELLRQARSARAQWEGFPGFRATLAVNQDGTACTGSLTVDRDGGVTLSGLPAGLEAVERILESLVQHRLPADQGEESVSFVDEETDHPLGRAIRIADDLHSLYRIRGDVICEVNREGGDSRFTISVIDVARNAEGKYLPHVYTVSNWSQADGKLVSSSTSFNDWTRVGSFDLPERIVEVRSRDNQRSVLALEFSGHELLPAAEVPAATE